MMTGSSAVDDEDGDNLTQTAEAPAAVGELHYDDEMRQVRRELDWFEASLGRADGAFAETFVTAASPGIVTTTMTLDPANPAYATDEEYVLAVAEEIKRQYDHIVLREHVLQIDAPDLAMERSLTFQDRPLEVFLRRAELHIEAINRASATSRRTVRGYTRAGATTPGRTSTTSTSGTCCRCSTAPTSERCTFQRAIRDSSTTARVRAVRPAREPRPDRRGDRRHDQLRRAS